MRSKKVMDRITVIDHEIGKVFQYKIASKFECFEWGWNPDVERCEQFLSGEGHNLANINWMCHNDSEFITN